MEKENNYNNTPGIEDHFRFLGLPEAWNEQLSKSPQNNPGAVASKILEFLKAHPEKAQRLSPEVKKLLEEKGLNSNQK